MRREERRHVPTSEEAHYMPYMIQGNSTPISTEPFLVEDKHFIPLREVIEALGGALTFDNTSKTATATIGPWTAYIPDGETSINVSGNGQNYPVTLTAAPFIEDGTLYVPWDFLKAAFGYETSLQDGTLSIVNPNA
jgi:hypothetical protein